MKGVEDNSKVVRRVCEGFGAAVQIYDCGHSVRSVLEGLFHHRSNVTVCTESNDVDSLHGERSAGETASMINFTGMETVSI